MAERFSETSTNSLALVDGINLVEVLVNNPTLAKRRSKSIERSLQREFKMKDTPGIRVILLGTGNSGKTYFYLT